MPNMGGNSLIKANEADTSDELELAINNMWPDDFIPTGLPTSSTPVVIIDEDKYEAMEARLAELEAQIKAGYGLNWKERYSMLHSIHVEDVRRRKEVRNFRAVNFSVAELLAALERKTTGKEPPPKENWGGIVMSALQLTEDAIKTLTNIRPHVPDEVQTRMRLYGRRDSYYARHKRLTDEFKEMQRRSMEK